MAVYFYIDLDCHPRKELGPEVLLTMLRDRALAATVWKGLREQYGDEMPESDMTFRRREVHEDGSQVETEFNVQEVREQTADLDRLAPSCDKCPASVSGEPYGCVQSIALPISEAAEEWLVRRVGSADSLTGHFFRQAVQGMNYGDCQRLKDWRAAGFLEADRPAEAIGEGDGAPVTSDQLLHPMLMVGDLSPAHCLSLLLFTRALETDRGGNSDEVLEIVERVQLTQSAEDVPGLRCNLTADPGDDPTIRAFKVFLHASYLALSLETSLAIRM